MGLNDPKDCSLFKKISFHFFKINLLPQVHHFFINFSNHFSNFYSSFLFSLCNVITQRSLVKSIIKMGKTASAILSRWINLQSTKLAHKSVTLKAARENDSLLW